jgi:WD40 repeat protein
MALTQQHEVIDLISDSEDESPSESAILTLQAFVPRKEKAAPRAQRAIALAATTPQPTKNIPVAQKPLAPAPTPAPAPDTTNGWPNIPASASIAEILSHGLQSAARSAGLLPRQPQQQTQPKPAVYPPSNVVSSFPHNGVPPGWAHNEYIKSGYIQKRSNSSSQSKPSLTATQTRVPRTNGPLHEERERRFIQYHQKEAERKSVKSSPQQIGQAVDTKAGSAAVPHSDRVTATTSQGALSSSRLNGNSSTHLHQRSPPTDGPEAKRRKTEHEAEADKIATGMSEARRLSAAAINEVHESVTHSQEPARAVPNRSSSILVGQDKSDSPVVRSNHENIDLTEEMDVCIDDSQPSIVTNQFSSKQDSAKGKVNLATAISLNDAANEEESDSPDEIPAKPARGRPSTVTRDVLPRPTVPASFHVPPEAMAMPKNDPSANVNLQIDLETRNDPLVMPKTIAFPGKGKGNHGIPYSAEEDSLLAHLREDLGISWDAMPKYFCGRTRGSLQVRYSSKVKNRNSIPAKPQAPGLHRPTLGEAAVRTEYTAPSRRHPKVSHRHNDFVSWAELKAQRQQDRATVKSTTPPTHEKASTKTPGPGLEVAQPVSLPRILRSRELGNTGRRNWSSTTRMKVSDDLQNHVLDTLGPRRYFHGASRDVTCIAWAAGGNKFAAGAIAIDDERSMQYNRPNNLLLGNLAQNSLHELPEHHVARPIVSDSRNVNSLQAMQETQDTRLFKTVAAVGFSEDSRALYSAGADGVVRMYDASSRRCLSSLKQEAELALLTSNSRGLLAAGSRRSDDSSISVIRSHSDRLECLRQFGPTRADVQSSLPIFPSALKWGAGIHSHLLLAGFASDSYEDDRLAAGEVFLWDSTADQKIELPAARNVFDVAWNPIPSSKASLFAVACARSGKQFRSSIECFAPNQGRASRVLQWDCPAFDINDLVYCPHDDNLIAAGATDGKVYIWDKRVVGCDAKPLHTLLHGQTKNVLDHDRDVEMADTGVRFLSWSATGNRLYSGSSDGTVKVWNPYRTTEDALVKDVATFNSAVMSGAFSPDFRDLLIGEDAGQLNLLGIDREARSVRAAKEFDYYPAPAPVSTMDEGKLGSTRELLASSRLEVRPMGSLPVKQIVQGPNYQGPYAGPSAEQISRLQAEFNLVLSRQMDAEKSLRSNPQDPELEKAFKAASSQVILSAESSSKVSEEREKYEHLRLRASVLQQSFHKSYVKHERMKSCELDCNHLPAAGDEDGEVPDNRLSEQRIPHSLRTHVKNFDSSDLTNAEIAEAGLTSKCSACMGPTAQSKSKSKLDLPVCERCTLVRSGLTARCETCAAPVRPNLDESIQQNICERCNFHCFRCGNAAAVSSNGDITCETCDIQWEAGVLGYEVKKKSHSSPIKIRHQSHEEMMESLDERMGRLLGEDERERLASGWRVALVDGYWV